MEKINLVEILKDCPTGMELDCTMFEGLEFDSIVDNIYFPIRCRIKNSNDAYNFYDFTKYGCWNNEYKAKCVIFPKGKTTWEGFQRPFKDGDIVATEHGIFIGIVKTKNNEHYETYCTINYVGSLSINTPYCFDRFATEEEKAKLFKVIKANSYRWNPETKTLEKLLKFKVGDKIRWKKNHNSIYTITAIREEENKYECGGTFVLRFSEQDNWELVPNKFDINTLKPFDKVFVRDSDKDMWCASIFSHTCKDKYFCVDTWHNQCIPYEGNEHLLGKKYDCDEYYKTWE